MKNRWLVTLSKNGGPAGSARVHLWMDSMRFYDSGSTVGAVSSPRIFPRPPPLFIHPTFSIDAGAMIPQRPAERWALGCSVRCDGIEL